MCRSVRLAINSISVVPDGLFSGAISHRNPFEAAEFEPGDSDRARLKIEKVIMVCMAGPVAERKYAPKESLRGHGGAVDFDMAADLALRLFRSKTTADAYLRFVETWVRQKLDDPSRWRAVECLAEALMRQGRLSGREAESIIAGALRPA